MKMKLIIVTFFLSLGLAMASASLSGCSAGGHIGPVGGSAEID